jgi:hypothetical protein
MAILASTRIRQTGEFLASTRIRQIRRRVAIAYSKYIFMLNVYYTIIFKILDRKLLKIQFF